MNNRTEPAQAFHIRAAYSGHLTDERALKRSSSGGAASALSAQIIRSGGVVFGAAYTADFRGAEFRCARTEDELEALRGSKYITARKTVTLDGEEMSVYRAVGQMLRGGVRVLFIGLPCEVAALDAYLAKNAVPRDTLYTADLICHGPTDPRIQADTVAALEKQYQSRITAFSVRYKARGWTPPYLHARFANGREHRELFYESDMGFAFKYYTKSACYSCRFKGSAHTADLTLGDYWGCREGMEDYHPLGVSVLLIRTERGQQLADMLEADSAFHLRPTDASYAIGCNRSFFQCREKPAEWDAFDRDFAEHGLHYAVTHHPQYKTHRMTACRRMIKMCIPPPLIKWVRQRKRGKRK